MKDKVTPEVFQKFVHPDFTKLLERYRQDTRYNAEERIRILTRLTAVKTLVLALPNDPNTKAIMLTGSYSSNSKYKKGRIDPYGLPESDIDIVIIKKKGITTFKDTPAKRALRQKAREIGLDDISRLIEVHTIVLPNNRIRRIFLDVVAKRMLKIGTLATGNINSAIYGVERDNESFDFERGQMEN